MATIKNITSRTLGLYGLTFEPEQCHELHDETAALVVAHHPEKFALVVARNTPATAPIEEPGAAAQPAAPEATPPRNRAPRKRT